MELSLIAAQFQVYVRGKALDKPVPPPRFGVVVVDMQPCYLSFVNANSYEALVRSQREVLRSCARNDVPVAALEFHLENIAPERTIPEIADALAEVRNSVLFKKESPDGFDNPSLDTWLKEMNVDSVYLMGVLSHSCVIATAQGAARHGYGIATSSSVIAPNKPSDVQWFVENGLYTDNHSELLPLLRV